MDPRLEEILDEEKGSFLQEARENYVKLADVAKITPNLEEAVFVIGSSPVKKYTSKASAALKKHKAILLAAKGQLLGKLVSIVEMIKQQTEGRVVQLNRASLTDSLVNPEFKPGASLNNVLAFFNEQSEVKVDQIMEKGSASIGKEGGNVEEVLASNTGVMSAEYVSAAVLSAVKRLIPGAKIYQVPTMSIVLAIGDLKLPEKSWTKQVTA